MKTIMISALQLVLILCIAVTVCSIQNVARESTHVPFTSCNNQGGISTVLKCYRHCMRQRDVFYMIGHDPGMEKCYCCHSAPGIDDIFITGEELQTYITGGYMYCTQGMFTPPPPSHQIPPLVYPAGVRVE